MNRLFARLAMAVLAAAVTGALPATPAHADPERITIPGCYGVSPAVVCSVTLTYGAPVAFVEYGGYQEVCVQDCYMVPVKVPVPTTDPTLCVSWTNRAGVVTEHCDSVGTVPPLPAYPGDLVTDTFDGVMGQLWPILDPPVCDTLKWIAGNHGPVYVNSQGDVYVDGEPFWDCPPYDIDWS